jgi:lysozyme
MARTPPKTPALIALAVMIATPLTAKFEGLRTKPYPDPGNPKILTVCFGDTAVPMRQYTPDECAVLLKARQARDYAPAVLKCVPGLAARTYAFAASVDFAYNAGTAAFCKSPMAKAFKANDYKTGCAKFRGYYVRGGGKVLKGLVRRREAEASLCARIA